MHHRSSLFLGLGLLALVTVGAWAEEGEKYALKYKFQPGETVRWNVLHRTRIRTTVSGTTQNAETSSTSAKVWKVLEVRADGAAVFEHSVEDVEMRQQLSGRQDVHYNSKTDKEVPAGFDDVAVAVGVPLSVITLDASGKVLNRERKAIRREGKPDYFGSQTDGDITIPMPAEAIPVGHAWSFPHDIDIPANNGRIVRVKTLQKFALREVQTGVAVIDVSTQILTPIHDPAIESQLVQCASKGSVRFDIDQGRILGQQMDLDKNVVGFRGDASSIHYVTRFSEDLVQGESGRVARAKTRP